MSGLVGRVEQLLELAGKATNPPWKTHAPWSIGEPQQTCISPVTVRGYPATIGKCSIEPDAALIVAAVNLVEPLARDWQRLKRIEEVARRFTAETMDWTDGSASFSELVATLAAVSFGEPDE